jgi:hypothetical protein
LTLLGAFCALGIASAASASTYILTITGPIAGGGHRAQVKPATIKLY